MEYADPADVPSPVSTVAPVACKEGAKEILADAWCTDGSSEGSPPTGTAVAIPPDDGHHLHGNRNKL